MECKYIFLLHKKGCQKESWLQRSTSDKQNKYRELSTQIEES